MIYYFKFKRRMKNFNTHFKLVQYAIACKELDESPKRLPFNFNVINFLS